MLTPDQKRKAQAALDGRATIAGIAAQIGATFEEVAVYLYGGGADFTPPRDRQAPQVELDPILNAERS